MATNNFLPFCETDTGTNLPTQSDYAADPNRALGAQPGVASSKLNNKPMRQATFITSQVAQFIADKTGSNVLDDGSTVKLLAQINAAILPIAPSVTRYLSSTGTHNKTYWFFIASGSATVGATYTNNAVTFTVKATVASAVMVSMTGGGDPAVSGTLTKASGTGDTTLSFYSVRSALSYIVQLVGGGGGGGGTTGGGGTGGTTTFGTSLLTAAGGTGGAQTAGSTGGAGGAPTVNSPAIAIVSVEGGDGISGFQLATSNGMPGGSSFFGGSGKGGVANGGPGQPGKANTGGGGGGGAGTATTGSGGGAAGAYIEALITSPSAAYTYAVGAGGTSGSGSGAGGVGGTGAIIVIEQFQ